MSAGFEKVEKSYFVVKAMTRGYHFINKTMLIIRNLRTYQYKKRSYRPQ